LFFVLNLFLLTQINLALSQNNSLDYTFTLKSGDSVTYQVVKSITSSGANSGSNLTEISQVKIFIVLATTENIIIQETKTNGNSVENKTITVGNQSELSYSMEYSFIFNLQYDYLLTHYSENNPFGITLNETSTEIRISMNESWVCHSCSWADKTEIQQYVYDKDSGWLITSSDIYSSVSSWNGTSYDPAVHYFESQQTNLTAIEWNVKEENSLITSSNGVNNTTFSDFEVIMSSIIVMSIITKKKIS
jgi:hypothetical protein